MKRKILDFIRTNAYGCGLLGAPDGETFEYIRGCSMLEAPALTNFVVILPFLQHISVQACV